MWEPPVVGNVDGLYILTIISSALAVIGSMYGFFKWIRTFFTKRFAEVDDRFKKIDKRFEKIDARFEKMDARFEMLENRMFQLAMGKSLKEIMLEERGENEKEEKTSHSS